MGTVITGNGVGVSTWLNWSGRMGPLSGKTALAVIIWLIAWAGLLLAYGRSAYETRRALTITLVLVGVGVLGSFPMFFQAFA